MFKYLPSVENALPTAPGSIDATAYKPTLSAYFAQSVNYDALNGIIDSVVAVLGAKGTDKEDINAKIRELVELLKSNGDLNNEEAKWILERDYSKAYTWEQSDDLWKLNTAEERWSAYWRIRDCAMCAVSCISRWNDKVKRQQLNEREQELVKRLDEARAALREVEREFHDYTFGCAVDCINDIFVKYADALQKIDKDWYDEIVLCLKRDVERVQKERAQKKLEDESAVNRPVEAK